MKFDLSLLLCSPHKEQAAARMAEAVKAVEKPVEVKNYKGFVAGVFSGIAKLSGKQIPLPPIPHNILLLVMAHPNKM